MRQLAGALLLLSACGGQTAVDGSPGARGAGGIGGVGSGGSVGGSGGVAGSGGVGESGGAGGQDDHESLRPPDDPMAAVPPDRVVTFAISRFYMGDTRRDGTPDPLAWREFGYDLDGQNSTPEDPDHCALSIGANPGTVKTDGAHGIDNSFGRHLMPLVQAIDPSAPVLDELLNSGSFTFILHNRNLSDVSDQSGVRTQLYVGAPMAGTPLFDGSDIWPVQEESLSDSTDIESALALFPHAFVADGIWVSGPVENGAMLILDLPFGNGYLPLRIGRPILTADIRDPTRLTRGVVAGVLDTEALIDESRQRAGSFDPGFCTATFDSFAQQIRAASDIMVDGSNGAGQACDGISIGLGFSARPVVRGGVTPTPDPPPDPCR